MFVSEHLLLVRHGFQKLEQNLTNQHYQFPEGGHFEIQNGDRKSSRK